jgi:hypothetical protein
MDRAGRIAMIMLSKNSNTVFQWQKTEERIHETAGSIHFTNRQTACGLDQPGYAAIYGLYKNAGGGSARVE